jgi:hypothetical protein
MADYNINVFNQQLAKKYLNKFSQKYIHSFYPNNKNTFLILLKKNNYSNLHISLSNLYQNLLFLVQSAIDILPQNIIKKGINDFNFEFKNKQNNLIAECTKKQIKFDSNINNNKLILINQINQILSNIDNNLPLYNKLKILYDKKYNFYDFDDEYENLLPYEKMILIDNIKKYIPTYYHDFYTHFIPLEILTELENKKIKLLCHFRNFNNNFYTINIKIPEKKILKFNKGGKLSHTLIINRRKKITNHEFIKPNTINKGGQNNNIFYDKRYYKYRYNRLLARIGWMYKSNNQNLLSKPLNINIFESTKPKILSWHERIIINNKINNNLSINHTDEKILSKYIGSNEINTGYSIPAINKIVIYRKEELDKIVIHELIHVMKLERNIFDDDVLNFFRKYLKYHKFCKNSLQHCNYPDTINDNSIMKITEAYTDFTADIINLFLYSVEIGINEKLKFNTIINLFIDFIFIEINFSLFQSAKLLTYFGFDNYYDIYHSSIKKGINEFLGYTYFENTQYYKPASKKNYKNYSIIKQTTSAFSYFILRTILLLNIKNIFTELNKSKYYNNKPNNFIEYFNLNTKLKGKNIQKILIKSLIDINNNNICNTNQSINIYIEIIRLLKINKIQYQSCEPDKILEQINFNECSIDDKLMTTMRRSIIEFR